MVSLTWLRVVAVPDGTLWLRTTTRAGRSSAACFQTMNWTSRGNFGKRVKVPSSALFTMMMNAIPRMWGRQTKYDEALLKSVVLTWKKVCWWEVEGELLEISQAFVGSLKSEPTWSALL